MRVYQFDATPRTTDATHFASVGGAPPNDATPLCEPPGFQLRATVDVHAAEVTALAYNPVYGFVAAGDAAGAVSLLDFGRRALQWLQVRGGAEGGNAAVLANSWSLLFPSTVYCFESRPLMAGSESPALTHLFRSPHSQAPLRAPIAALSLTRCPLPPLRDRHELIGCYSQLPPGALVRALAVIGADSSLCVLDAATGFFLAK